MLVGILYGEDELLGKSWLKKENFSLSHQAWKHRKKIGSGLMKARRASKKLSLSHQAWKHRKKIGSGLMKARRVSKRLSPAHVLSTKVHQIAKRQMGLPIPPHLQGEDFVSTEALLGKGFFSRQVRKVKNVAKKTSGVIKRNPYTAAALMPHTLAYSLATKKGRSNLAKPFKKVGRLIEKYPKTSALLMPHTLAYSMATKRGRRNFFGGKKPNSGLSPAASAVAARTTQSVPVEDTPGHMVNEQRAESPSFLRNAGSFAQAAAKFLPGSITQQDGSDAAVTSSEAAVADNAAATKSKMGAGSILTILGLGFAAYSAFKG